VKRLAQPRANRQIASMAVHQGLTDSRLEFVKEAVKSTTTCTASTFASLQLLLQATTPTTQNSRLAKKIPSTSTKSVACTKSTRSVKSQSEAKVEVTTNSQDAAGLSAQQRLVLATEVFNTTSKALADALQRNNSQKSPLQPTSPNRVVSSTKKRSAKPTKMTPAGKASSGDGIHSTAECAILALTTLRNAKSDNASNIDYPNLQLEQGVCILAGRLIALGLNDLAYKELKSLKKRLQEYMLLVSAKKPKESTSRSAQDTKTESGKEIIAELLTFSDMESAAPILSVLVSFQTNLLKLAISEKKILIADKTCKALATSNQSSPANIVSRSLNSGSMGKDKAALQLLSTSNNILTLSNTLQKTLTAGSDTTTNRGARLFSALTLQLVSMEYRVLSWELSGHKGDSKREYWDPLSRFLEVFSNYGSKIKPSEFTALSATLQRLNSKMTKTQMKGAGNPWKISYSLGKIAQDASSLQDALKQFSTAAEIVTAEHPMASSLIQCRIAFIHLCLFKGNKGCSSDLVIESLVTAALGIKSANKGNASDLEALLVESAKLKKLAMARLGESLSSEHVLPDKMIVAMVEFLHAFIRFLRRYVSRQPQSQGQSEVNEQLQILASAKNIIITAAESAIALGKMSLLNQVPAWELLQPVFSDCARLLSNFEDLEADDFDEGFNWRPSIVKLSNLFWSRYLKRREAGQGYEELIPLLDQSVGLLKGCPAAERVAGFAALKLERLAHLYLDARVGAKSMICFERSIQEHIDVGVLQEHMAYLSGRPPHTCLHDSNSPGYNLTRILSSYLKMQLRRPTNDDHNIFDNSTLDPLARGTLLEWQLGLLTEFHSHDADNEKFKDLFRKLLSEVLALYTGNQYPARRLRVIRLTLRFVLDHPNSMDNAITESLAEDAVSHLSNQPMTSNDVELENYAPNIQTSLNLILLFRNGDVKAESFREIIASWASMIRNCTSWDSLQSVVDDCDLLIAQINATLDYLEARGYWKLNLAAGEILLRVFELQNVRNNSSLILILSRCALQYCRLGDQKAASNLLERAKQHLDSGNVSCYTSMTYHLALAEYNLEIDNIDHAENALLSAQKLYQNKQTRGEISESRSQSKIAWERLIVDGALLYSRIADRRGCLKKALYYGKLSVRLSTRLWTKLERSADKKRESEPLTEKLSDVDLVIDGVANIDLAEAAAPPAWSYAEGAVFWRHITSHNACFLNLMRLSAYNGLFQDAIYYGEQALKVNKTLGTSFHLLTCQAELGLEWIRGNHVSEAKDVLDAATKLSEDLINSVETVKLKISLAALSRAQEDYEEVLRLLREAETMLGRISEVRLDPSLSVKSSDTGLEGKLANMKIRQASIQKEGQSVTSRQTRKTKATSKISIKADEDISIAPKSQISSQSLVMLRNEIYRRKIHTLLAIEDLDGASRLLDTIKDFSPSTASQISLQIEETEHLLADVMKSIATHAIYCVLPESTLSMPSIEPAIAIVNPPVARSKTPVTRKAKSIVKEPRSRNTKAAKKEVDITNIMSDARNAISKTVRDAVSTGSTVEGHTASGLMGRISMLLHATRPGLVDEDILTPVNANGKSL
jgi:separase